MAKMTEEYNQYDSEDDLEAPDILSELTVKQKKLKTRKEY